LQMPQDTLDHIVLLGRGDWRHDRHGFATATAQRRILQPDFGYQARPVAPALAQELIVLFLLDGGLGAGRRPELSNALRRWFHHGRIFDPADLLAESGRECPVGPNRHLIAKEHMRDEEGQKLQRGEQLVLNPRRG